MNWGARIGIVVLKKNKEVGVGLLYMGNDHKVKIFGILPTINVDIRQFLRLTKQEYAMALLHTRRGTCHTEKDKE